MQSQQDFTYGILLAGVGRAVLEAAHGQTLGYKPGHALIEAVCQREAMGVV